MPIKGPLKLVPRPLAENELTVKFRENDVDVDFGVEGPLGVPRPLARHNPDGNVTREEFISECQNSEWAIDLVEGLDRFVGGGISEERKQEIIENNCQDLATGIDFPISEQFKDRILGREVTVR